MATLARFSVRRTHANGSRRRSSRKIKELLAKRVTIFSNIDLLVFAGMYGLALTADVNLGQREFMGATEGLSVRHVPARRNREAIKA